VTKYEVIRKLNVTMFFLTENIYLQVVTPKLCHKSSQNMHINHI